MKRNPSATDAEHRIIRIKNWHEFQHYRDRKPPWIKLHRSILDDYEFHCLTDASKALAPCLWLLASEYEHGEIPFDVPMMGFRLHMPCAKVQNCLTELESKGFILYASGVLSERKQSAIPEVEVETEVEKRRGRLRAPRAISTTERARQIEINAGGNPAQDFLDNLRAAKKAVQ